MIKKSSNTKAPRSKVASKVNIVFFFCSTSSFNRSCLSSAFVVVNIFLIRSSPIFFISVVPNCNKVYGCLIKREWVRSVIESTPLEYPSLVPEIPCVASSTVLLVCSEKLFNPLIMRLEFAKNPSVKTKIPNAFNNPPSISD